MVPRTPAVVITLLLAVSDVGAGPREDLARLCDEYWQGHLKAHPVAATAIGDRRYDDRLEDITPAGLAKEKTRLEDVLRRARAIDERALDTARRLDRRALIEDVSGQLDAMSCGFEDWVVDPMNGPQTELVNLADYTVIQSPEDAARYVTRCKAMARYLDAHSANLARGLARGRVATRDAVTRTIEQLDGLEAKPVAEWALLAPAKVAHQGWSASARERFGRDLERAIQEDAKPAFRRYRDFLSAKVMPAARPPEKSGIVALEGGLECYRKMIRVHTSLDLTPEEIHKIGLEQVAKFRRDLGALGAKTLGTPNVAEIQKKLRTDPAMHFRTADEVEGKAREALARAEAAIPKWFGTLPKAPCVVKVMGEHEAPYSTIAYYRQPATDGSRPGTYMINTYKPETRPRYEAEALAWHESIPGHHLQIAIAQELSGLPEFRKHQGFTSFVEGWALYTERLADEMGLYSADVDRIGMLSYDAWRACRLVVDTGIHAMGWSRQQAIDYMVENSVLAENNIVNEVDRYIGWPGQALAYKLGQLEILKLRDEGRQRLGQRFDIKGFHDVVLRNGAVALPVLRDQVEAYYAQVEAAK